MAQSVTIAKHYKRRRTVLENDFVSEATCGEFTIREGDGHHSNMAILDPKAKRTHAATPALEERLREASSSKELNCPPDFFTARLDD